MLTQCPCSPLTVDPGKTRTRVPTHEQTTGNKAKLFTTLQAVSMGHAPCKPTPERRLEELSRVGICRALLIFRL